MKKMTLGGRIESARKAQGLTAAQLASRLGVLTKTIRNWLSDRSEPRANKLVTLAGVLNVSVMWLMTGTESDMEKDIATSDETASLSSKMERLLSLHQQTSVLIMEVQGEVNHLQNQIDMGEMAIAENWLPETKSSNPKRI
ncbi:MAG: helix-turn-helix domain-containing protein [Rhodospirillaceae bacterium]|nr:helix-turn-helix domain-containing protein [Rhodospirillaceae bacterium]